MPSLTRLLVEWLRPGSLRVETLETTYDRGGGRRDPATIYRPARARAPLPAWVLLHGITYTGREHPQLVRLARALSAAGNVVMVPEIAEWRSLRVAPEVAVPVIQAAVLDLDARPDTIPGRTALMGFSFGATQGILAAADPRLDGHLAAVVSWGAYGDLHRLTRFLFSGEWELDGATGFEDPDPYGRWVLGANALPAVPGHEEDADVARALHELAAEAGRRGVYAGDAAYDPFRLHVRRGLPAGKRRLFDLFVTTGPRRAIRSEAALELASAMADAAIAHSTLYDPTRYVQDVRVPVLLAHGRHDRLIPWTECPRLDVALGERSLGSNVTGLYTHSGKGGGVPNVRGAAVAWARMAALMRRLIGLNAGS